MSYKKLLILSLPLLILAGAYYAFQWREYEKIENIIIEGNVTIHRDEILKAARLTDTTLSVADVNIDLLQDRISKHPEIKKVFVSKELPADLRIEVIERKPAAIINSGHELLLVDEELEIFSFKNMKKLYDLPLISGIRTGIKPNSNKFNPDDLRLALFIIKNSVRKSKYLYNNISEINLSDPSKILLFLSEDSAPVYFPRRNDVTVADSEYQEIINDKLEVLLAYLRSNLDDRFNSEINYIDMRFSNQVVINSNN
jgi:cell division septal protein FtsQ